MTRVQTRKFYVFDDSGTSRRDFKEAGRELGLSEHISTYSTVDASLEEIKRFSRRRNEEPVFVVDLSMGEDREAGFRIMSAIRKKSSLKKAPVIVVTSSSEKEIVNQCFDEGANAFYVKESTPKEFRNDMRRLLEFWSQSEIHSGSWQQV